MGRKMGLDFGLGSEDTCFKRKFRWLLSIDGICADDSPRGVNSLPPQKSARPSFDFKEIEVQHLNETIYYPAKPEFKPITLVLYDLKKNKHPVFKWIQDIYDPCTGKWKFNSNFKKEAKLELYDGCGDIIETWIYENAWPQVVEFGELDMGLGDYVTVEISLRYDRAYIKDECS